MGLIQRRIEEEGIPTVSISIVRSITEKIKPPRAVFLDQPFGHPMGEAFNRVQQRAILLITLKALFFIERPGRILDLTDRLKKAS